MAEAAVRVMAAFGALRDAAALLLVGTWSNTNNTEAPPPLLFFLDLLELAVI